MSRGSLRWIGPAVLVLSLFAGSGVAMAGPSTAPDLAIKSLDVTAVSSATAGQCSVSATALIKNAGHSSYAGYPTINWSVDYPGASGTMTVGISLGPGQTTADPVYLTQSLQLPSGRYTFTAVLTGVDGELRTGNNDKTTRFSCP